MSLLARCKDSLVELSNLAHLARDQEPPVDPTYDETNPITYHFKIFDKITVAGQGLVWSVHDAYRKRDGRHCAVFFFDKREGDKLYKPKRKDELFAKLKQGITRLYLGEFKQTLEVCHSLEQSPFSMAFASEPVIASMHQILAWYELTNDSEPVMPCPPDKKGKYKKPRLQPYAKEYQFLDIEIRVGILQVLDALKCLHIEKKMIHTNVCPSNIMITRRGTWKLMGLEFLKEITTENLNMSMPYEPYNVKFSSASQPSLDYSAPEVQACSKISILSDMFSMGMVLFALYNNGRSLIQANENPMLYLKQLETLKDRILLVLPNMPIALQDPAERLLLRDPKNRPSTTLLSLTNYFSSANDAVIKTLQGFNSLKDKNTQEKVMFLRTVRPEILDQIPRKLRLGLIIDSMRPELSTAEGLVYGLELIIYILKDESDEIYTENVYPSFRNIFTKQFISRNPDAVCSYLDAMHLFLSKCDEHELIRDEIIQVLVASLEHQNETVLESAMNCLIKCKDWLDESHLVDQILPHIEHVLEKHFSDLNMSLKVMLFFEEIMSKLDKDHLVMYIVPSILLMNLDEPSVMDHLVSLYKVMVTDERLGLPHDLLATRLIPCVAPQAVNKYMDHAQLAELMKMLYNMLERVETQQRIVIEEYKHRPPTPPNNNNNSIVRRQISFDGPAPVFCIPSLKRKISSAEEMARQNYTATEQPAVTAASVTDNIRRISQWFFGSNNSTNSNNMNMGGATTMGTATSGNFLRVANQLPSRRLSDNTLMAPKIKIAPSCASSPGVTPGVSQATLPTRRHSSIGPQEQHPSHYNLSPPIVQYGRGRGTGSGPSLSVPAHSYPAGGSLPGSTVTHLEPTKGSAHSMHSAHSALAARVALSARTSPMRPRRVSGCPPSASSGTAAASLQDTEFSLCGSHAVRRQSRGSFTRRPSSIRGGEYPSLGTRASSLLNNNMTRSLSEQVGRAASGFSGTMNDMKDSLTPFTTALTSLAKK